jgi:hypothetical protein
MAQSRSATSSPPAQTVNASRFGDCVLTIETTIGRYKPLIGPRLRARGFAAQQTEAAIGVAVLNRMLAAGRPDAVCRQAVIV